MQSTVSGPPSQTPSGMSGCGPGDYTNKFTAFFC